MVANLPMPTPAESLRYFLPYHQRWIDDQAQVAIAEKSRRIGFTYAESYRSVERRIRLGTDHLFASRTKADARGFIDYCKMWARVFNAVAEDLGETVIDEESGLQAFTLRFANGAKILALSSHADAFRSYGGDVTLDELAFHKDQRGVLKGARASAILWGHQLRIISTHNGEGSFYNQLICEVAAGKRPKWSHHRVTLQDAVDQGFAELVKVSHEADPDARLRILQTPDRELRERFVAEVHEGCITEDEWLEEYCCVPNTDAGAYLSYALIDNCMDASMRLYDSIDDLPTADDIEYYGGYDIGRRHDLSVLWNLQPVGDVLWTRMLSELTGEEQRFSSQATFLDRFMGRPNVKRLAMDQTGMGEQLTEQRIEKWGTRVEGVLLTGPRKAAIAAPFKGAFEDRRIRIPKDDALREDLHKTRKIVTAGGNVRLHAESDEDGHADRFWAGALAYEAAGHPGQVGGMAIW